VHVFGDDDATIERSIVIDGRGQYPQSDWLARSTCLRRNAQFECRESSGLFTPAMRIRSERALPLR